MTKVSAVEITPFDAAEYLTDEQGIAEFLNASIELDDPAVLLNAICTVARARSMSQLAEASGLGRESLYKALKPGAQPRYDTVMRVLGALGVKMIFRASKRASPVRSKSGSAISRARKPGVRATASNEKRASGPPRRKA